jgi:hypothetical protein
MRRSRTPVIAGLIALLVAMCVFGTATGRAGAEDRACATGSWPTVVRGQPDALLDADETGAYVWTDADGWHVRVTHSGTARRLFRGSVETTRELVAVSRAAGSNNQVRFTKDRTRTRFDLVSFGGIDGIDFQVGCSSGFLFRMTLDGTNLTAAQVFLGTNAENPPSMPVRIER